LFGQGCLLARRLVERGVPFIEVSLSSTNGNNAGWDTHQNNFESVAALSGELDAGWASLMSDLKERGLLESTTIVWMGEFGRTPQINGQAGRDHFPRAWSCVLGGGGIAGGQTYGRTSDDGMDIEEDPVGVSDVLATMCEALGVDPAQSNISNTGRPIALVDGTPIRQLLT
jgi:arylsulfatase A-like enzyme